MNIIQRIQSVHDMLMQACKTGSLENLAVVAIGTFAGCLFASAAVRKRVERVSPQHTKPTGFFAEFSKPERLACSFAALFFVWCFLEFAAGVQHEPVMLMLLIVRAILSSLLAFSCALVAITIVQAVLVTAPFVAILIQMFSAFATWASELISPEEPEPERSSDPTQELMPPADPYLEQLRDAQLEYQRRLTLVENSGLDPDEQEAVEDQLKQDYLRSYRNICQSNPISRR